MISIYVDGKELDLYGNETVAITFSALNISEINTRKGAFSNTFKVPATAKNKNIFGVSNDVHSLSLVPYRYHHVLIEEDAVPIAIGTCTLKTANDNTFELSVFANNTNWFEKLEDKNLQDLNLDKFNHKFTMQNVRNTRSTHHSWQDGYVYPNVEYGNTFNTGGAWLDWRHFRPGVYAKMIFYETLAQQGFEPTGKFWDDDKLFFDEINGINDIAGNGGSDSKYAAFLPFALSEFKRDTKYERRNNLIAIGNYASLGPTTSTEIFFNNFITNTPYDYDWHDAANRLLIIDRAEVVFKFTITFNAPSPTGIIIWMDYYDDEGNYVNPGTNPLANIIGDAQLFIPVSVFGNTTLSTTFTRKVGPGNMRFFYTGGQVLNVSIQLEIIDFKPLLSDGADLIITDKYNYVTLTSTLPSISQKEFIKFICMKWGLVPYHDGYSNKIRFEYLSDILNNATQPYDWSDKLDLSETPTISFDLGYEKRLVFKDLNDDNDKFINNNTTYNEAYIDTQTQLRESDTTIYESPFSMLMRQSNSYNNSIRLGYIPAYTPIDESVPNNPNDLSLFDKLQSAPKFCLIRFEPYHLIQMQYLNAVQPLETPTQPALHGLAVVWQNMIERYYKALEPIIVYPKIVNCLIRLNSHDINTLDLSRPVWIDYFKSFFLINEIRQYKCNEKESTEVELVKLGWDLEGGVGFDLNENKRKYLLLENNLPYLHEYTTQTPITLEEQ